MDDYDIARVLKGGFSLPDEEYREDLLHRCLAELCSDGRVLEDDELDLLAAAGEVFVKGLGGFGNEGTPT